MFYILDVEDYVRVEPKHFGLFTHEAIEKQLNEDFADSVSKEYGYVVSVLSVGNIANGVIIPGDGAAFYKSDFKLLAWKPELHELAYCTVSEVTNFGAFMEIGPARGMIHISQTMEDYVSVSKTGTLSGKSSKRTLGEKDDCIARIVAISYKAGTPKIGLTMRQSGLGKLQWLDEDLHNKVAEEKKAAKKVEKGKKDMKGGKKK